MTDETATTPVDAAPVVEAPAPAPVAEEAPAPVDNVITEVAAAPVVSESGVTIISGDIPAQVKGPPNPPQTTVAVQEAIFNSDRVITDTSDPLAVQVPAPDPNDAFTPIGQAHRTPVTPEQAFAASE